MSPFVQAYYHLGCAARHAGKAAAALWACAAGRVMLIGLVVIALMLLCGCSILDRVPRVSVPATELLAPASATAPRDTGKPATVASAGEESRIALPAGSTITVTRTEAQPATERTPARPAIEVREIHLSSDSAWYERAQHIAASTGTIDTSVAMHRIDVAERRWLLWTAIACGIAGIVVRQVVPLWPGLSNGLLMGAALAGAAWKFSAIPSWIFAVAIGACALIAIGYKRAEWDKDGDGIPDILER